jgi:hypothetical protein
MQILSLFHDDSAAATVLKVIDWYSFMKAVYSLVVGLVFTLQRIFLCPYWIHGLWNYKNERIIIIIIIIIIIKKCRVV